MSSVNSENIKIDLTGTIKKELKTIEVKKEHEKNCSEHSKISSDSHTSQHNQDSEHSCYYSSQTSVPNTILITNNYSQNERSIGLNNKQSSITIVTHNNSETDHTSNKMPTSAGGSTVVLDRINICINNHFNESRTSIEKSSLVTDTSYQSDIVKEKPSMTESDSNMNSFSSLRESVKSEISINGFSTGQDVLVQKKDGRFYLGTIIAITRNQSLVKFDDNTEYWSSFEELTTFGVSGQNDEPMCVVCKKLNKTDVVEVCERCGRGYHRKCAGENFQKKGIWFCRRCTAPNGFKTKSLESKNDEYKKSKTIFNQILHKSQLPYKFDSLSWDVHHRVNGEQIYCYCGKNGQWFNKMLQCCKCQQWFHETCVSCLNYPVFAGDGFYIFACTMCNKGKEFLRRLELKWNDVVHLILFNITLYNERKYYHANKTIVPYAIENWPKLQLQPSMRNLSVSSIKDNIMKTLSMNSSRFKCGKEIKKRRSFWGLRSRIPPPSPKIIIPEDIELTDQGLRDLIKLNIIPTKIIEKNDNITYMNENYDNESSSDISDEDFFQNDISNKDIIENKEGTLSSKGKDKGKVYCRHLSELVENKNVHLNGFDSNDLSDKSHDCLDYDESKDENIDEDPDPDPDRDIEVDVEEESKATSFELSNTKHKRKRNSTFYSSKSSTDNIIPDIIEISDSSDETSSRGTLDLIIPPPKNFQGRNNPFRLTPKKNENNNKKMFTKNTNAKTAKVSGIFLPDFSNMNHAAGQFRMVRTVKRRLSAKDIMIGPNKEVKRRRFRRRSGNFEVISTSLLSFPKSATQLPMRTDSKDIPLSAIRSTLNSASSSTSNTSQGNIPKSIRSISSVLNGRRLRQRQGKNYSENFRRNSCPMLNTNSNGSVVGVAGSSNKDGSQSDVSLSELKTSVNMYFGGINRIIDGEQFIFRAKRYTPDGKTQYLIEWEGVS